MPALPTNLRRDLERTVIKARDIAEAGAKQALEALTVHEAKPGGHLDAAGRTLRNRLRAHARQLGDARDAKTDRQAIDRLTHECAYEHWHRMLFARFLAENDLLVEPESGVSVTLEEVEELARDAKINPWELASRYAQGALPQIFRPDDPVLAVELFPEVRAKLEDELEKIPRETFLADDSLGWVYQFWQSKRKDEVNASGEKITGDTLPAVTQLFTEHYMVEFLLHNTLGAWHAGKVLAARPELAASATSEQQLRDAVALHTDAGDVEWTYLRFVRDTEDGPWRPAAGVFPGWPREAKDLKVLDPCCGSGHFLVAAFHLLVRLRMQEEGLSAADAAFAVLRENLFALELDQRCVQLAAFNVALAAWTLVGRRIELPELHIACSGIAPSASEEEWIKLAEESGKPFPRGGAEPIRDGLRNLHSQFSQAAILGSLIDPGELSTELITADYETLRPYLDAVFAVERASEELRERAVAALDIVKAAELLRGDYTLVITNVPYLGRGKQDDRLKEWALRHESAAKADLATIFISRSLKWLVQGGSIALVSPQNWLFLNDYKSIRKRLLSDSLWQISIRLGPGAFETISGEVVKASLQVMTRVTPNSASVFYGADISGTAGAAAKATTLPVVPLNVLNQEDQLKNPNCVVTTETLTHGTLLQDYATGYEGAKTVDIERFRRAFWEVHIRPELWWLHNSSPTGTDLISGCHYVSANRSGGSEFERNIRAYEQCGKKVVAWKCGSPCWHKMGVAVSWMNNLPASLYVGSVFDNSAAVILPRTPELLPAVYCFVTSDDYRREVRKINQKVQVAAGTLDQVPFDLAYWQSFAAEKYPDGLPKPESDDPAQWLFHGHPEASEHPLQVAVARLVGYRWPAELDTEMQLSDRARQLAASCDGLLKSADADGIVCLDAVRGEPTAADRLRGVLAIAYGPKWSAAKEAELLAAVGCAGESLDGWLRTKFFEEHCKLFHNRPFIWHIWDGKKDGFHALVSYHQLAAPDGAGRRTLDKLTHVYLRDWTTAQADAVKRGETGAEARLAAAETLKRELENILDGEPPYDLFVRWKPLHKQSIGWNPDINDGLRPNIRPFLKAKDVDRKGAGILRLKPNLKWPKDKGNDLEGMRAREEFPWLWGWNETTQDFAGGATFDGNRWNDLHYTNRFKQAARDKRKDTP